MVDFTLLPFLFIYFWPHHAACGILVPQLKIEPRTWQQKCPALTTGLPGNHPPLPFLKNPFKIRLKMQLQKNHTK